jgi:hypothetical protein
MSGRRAVRDRRERAPYRRAPCGLLRQLSSRLDDANWLDGTFSVGDLMMVSVRLWLRASGIHHRRAFPRSSESGCWCSTPIELHAERHVEGTLLSLRIVANTHENGVEVGFSIMMNRGSAAAEPSMRFSQVHL